MVDAGAAYLAHGSIVRATRARSVHQVDSTSTMVNPIPNSSHLSMTLMHVCMHAFLR